MKFRMLMAALIASMAASASQAALIHQYDFNGNLKDSLGGVSLFTWGGTFSQSSYIFERGQGLELGEHLGKSYSVDMSYQFSTLVGYQKILDFRAFSSGTGMYTDTIWYDFVGLSGRIGSPLVVNQPTRLTFTRTEGGLVSIYQNGTLISAVNDWNNAADLSRDYLNFFIADGWEPWSKNGAGSVDYIRIYDDALTAQEVQKKPDAPVPEPGSIALLAAGLGLLGFLRFRRQA